MIAVPVKNNNDNTALAPSFGKSKWIAFIDNSGKTTFWKNEKLNGRAVIEALVDHKVTKVLLQSIGEKPHMLLNNLNIKSFFAGEKRVLLSESISNFMQNALPEVTPTNRDDYIVHHHHHHKH